MADKQSKNRKYLHLYSFISDDGDSISFRLNPDGKITEELFHKYELSNELTEEELNKEGKVQLLHKIAKIRESDIEEQA